MLYLYCLAVAVSFRISRGTRVLINESATAVRLFFRKTHLARSLSFYLLEALMIHCNRRSTIGHCCEAELNTDTHSYRALSKLK